MVWGGVYGVKEMSVKCNFKLQLMYCNVSEKEKG